jgi:ketosteroid isomerase-like protein
MMRTTTQEQQNVDCVKDIYYAIGQGDILAVTGMMTEDVEIHFPGPEEIPFAGVFHGHEGVKQFAAALAEGIDWDTRELEVEEFIARGNKVVVIGHENLTAKPTGKSWETDWAMVWAFNDGKIKSLKEFHETASIATAFQS